MLDSRVVDSYIARSESKGLKNPLYDSYVRAIRWASNRVLDNDSGGIVAFVTNSGFWTAKRFDGLRKTIASEFHTIHVYNLRGNQRTSGEQSRREGGKVFGSGSRAGVAILLLVRRPGSAPDSAAEIRFRDVGDYLTPEQKLEVVAGRVLEMTSGDQSSPVGTVTGSTSSARPTSHYARSPRSRASLLATTVYRRCLSFHHSALLPVVMRGRTILPATSCVK